MSHEQTDEKEPDIIAGMDEAMGLADEPADEPAEAPETDEAPEAPEGESDEAQPSDKPDDEPGDKPAEKDEAAEKEISDLGLKEKAAQRFRDLTGEIKALAPIKEALESAGIKDVAELPKLVEKAKASDEIIGMVMETGASAEQYGKSLDYLGIVNKAMKGDAKAGEQAWAALMGEVQSLASLLGKELPGVHDPLDAHADLKAQVDNGDMTRAAAMEVAKARESSKRAEQTQQATQQQQQHAQAVQQGEAAIAQLDQQYMAADPQYKHRRGALSRQVAYIKQNLPPNQWAAATQAAYESIKLLPVAEAPKKPPPGPVRPGPKPAANLQPEFDDPYKALDAGIASAA